MTPDEAIEKLNRHYVLFLNVPRAELIDAARLGIEALERHKAVRGHKWYHFHTLVAFVTAKLPSEGEKE